MEKQKLRAHYAISEKQLVIAFHKAKMGEGKTNEKLIRSIEARLDAFLYHSGFAPTIFAAKQFITHGHIMVDGHKVNRPSYQLKEGQAVTINAEKSPSIAEIARKSNTTVPGYIMVETEALKATFVRVPEISEIPVNANIMSVVEFYAR
jgi:small subunit ribosomal protein S4